MEEIAILKQLIPQAPGLVGIIVVVGYFLSHLKHQSTESRAEREARDKLFTDTIGAIHRDNLEARAVSRDAIRENTAATIRMTEKMEAATAATTAAARVRT